MAHRAHTVCVRTCGFGVRKTAILRSRGRLPVVWNDVRRSCSRLQRGAQTLHDRSSRDCRCPRALPLRPLASLLTCYLSLEHWLRPGCPPLRHGCKRCGHWRSAHAHAAHRASHPRCGLQPVRSTSSVYLTVCARAAAEKAVFGSPLCPTKNNERSLGAVASTTPDMHVRCPWLCAERRIRLCYVHWTSSCACNNSCKPATNDCPRP